MSVRKLLGSHYDLCCIRAFTVYYVGMSKPTHTDVHSLLRDVVLPFYHVKRTTPLPIGERRWENDAEHSWAVAFLACSLAPQIDPKLDLGKVAQFAIAHDVVEVYAGDTSTFASEEELAGKEAREAKALERLSEEFAHFPWIAQTIEEYERKACDEARFVYAVDKYIAVALDLIDEGQYYRDYKLTWEAFDKSMAVHRKKAHSHPGVAKYYDEVREILDSHPEYFHGAK
jgi:5'-deoxynucleotidase YfbR-like HD superfamily hydrolase